MNTFLYDVKTKCPVCGREFTYTKVRMSHLKVLERRKDLYTKYDGIEPFFYDPIVCPNCGYAALSDVFNNISDEGKKEILSKITTNWTKRKFSGERTPQKALESYLLSLYCSQLKNDKDIIFAKTCLRIAWIYNILGDYVNENKYLKISLDKYKKAYEGDEAYDGEIQLIYMIGELNKILGYRDEALKWFNKVINHPDRKNHSLIVNYAKDEWQSLKI
ncbi:DUF2225 domain-containing protein [Thermoanaerobacterium thermosaccharolyticum]|jgi:uncharacterized protein|uniref:DUF2225 domain-containing protein n=1 Tax=Thermoanaerobacterium thermosaccharolyticum TaxID=1517 RepID=UPI002FDAF8D5